MPANIEDCPSTGEENKRLDSRKLRQDQPNFSPRKRALFICTHWVLFFLTLYYLIFSTSSILCLLSVLVSFFYYGCKIYNNRLAVLPYQSQFVYWLKNSHFFNKFQEIFYRRIQGNLNLKQCRTLGFYLFFLGLLLLVIIFTDPIIEIDKMVVVQGAYDSKKKLGRKNYCGNWILSFRKQDGSLTHYYAPSLDSTLLALERTKGEVHTIWEESNKLSPIPECRKYPSIAQIHGIGIRYHYDKARRKKARWFLYTISTIVLLSSGLCLLGVVRGGRK